jgi:hypothetical protein
VLNQKSNNDTISQYDYGYDNAGRQNYKKQAVGSSVKIATYVYDKAGRISDVKNYPTVESYETGAGYTYQAVYKYDNGGNRTAVSETYTTADKSMVIPNQADGSAISYKTKVFMVY